MSNLPVSQILPTASIVRKGNVGAGEETLLSFFLPPGLLKNIGDSLMLHGAVQLAANANAKTGKLYIGGTTIAGRSASESAAFYDMIGRIYRINANTIWCAGLTANSLTATQLVSSTDIAGLDFTNPIEIKLTGQGVAADDVVSRVLRYVYFPVGSNRDF